MNKLINGRSLQDVERVEGLVKDLGSRVGLPTMALESSDLYEQFKVMHGNHRIGNRSYSLGTVEKLVAFSIDLLGEAVMNGDDNDDEPPF
jgi:hypothetical protein